MSSLDFNTNGPWGHGAGLLTLNQFDTNFWTIWQIYEDVAAGAGGAEIDYFEMVGTSLYVHMTNHTILGPYPLPLWQPVVRGEWQPDTAYNFNDSFYFNGATYLVLVAHTSQATFSAAYTISGQNVYSQPILVTPGNSIPLGGQFGQELVATAAGGSEPPPVGWSYQLPTGGESAQVLTLVTPSTSDSAAVTDWTGLQAIALGTPIMGGVDGDLLYVSGSTLQQASLDDLLDVDLGISVGMLSRTVSSWQVIPSGSSGNFLQLTPTKALWWAPVSMQLQLDATPISGSAPNQLLYSDGTDLQVAYLGPGLSIVDGVLDVAQGDAFDYVETPPLDVGQVPVYNGHYWTNETVPFTTYSSTVAISSADFLYNGGLIQLEIAPAPGTGLALVPLAVVMRYNFNTTPYNQSGGGASIGLDYGTTGGTTDIRPFSSDPVLNQTQSTDGVSTMLGFSENQSVDLTNLPLVVNVGGLVAGPILTSSLNGGGIGYLPGDTGILSGDSGDATYQVLTVSAGGVVTYAITSEGTSYYPSSTVSTSPGGAQPGIGTGFTINIGTVAQGDGDAVLTTVYAIVPSP